MPLLGEVMEEFSGILQRKFYFGIVWHDGFILLYQYSGAGQTSTANHLDRTQVKNLAKSKAQLCEGRQNMVAPFSI